MPRAINSSTQLRAARFRNGKVKSLGKLAGSESEAFAVNHYGTAVGQSADAFSRSRAVGFQRGNVIQLGTLPGAVSALPSRSTTAAWRWDERQLGEAFGINKDGQIVGRSNAAPGGPFRATLWTKRRVCH